MALRMEATPFELTPAQKDLLESLARETGKAIPALLDEALEELKAHVRQHTVNGEPHSSDWGHAAPPSHEAPQPNAAKCNGQAAAPHRLYPSRPCALPRGSLRGVLV